MIGRMFIFGRMPSNTLVILWINSFHSGLSNCLNIEHVGKCSTQVRKVAVNILELISEGLGIEYGHFSDELSQETVLSVNYYPPCPDPCLTLGITKHCAPNLITILLQGDVHGLQGFKDGEWIGVEPLPQGLVWLT